METKIMREQEEEDMTSVSTPPGDFNSVFLVARWVGFVSSVLCFKMQCFLSLSFLGFCKCKM